ncbi:MAG: hypothetical protein M3454_08275 [Actinomycetota bacterium]|nr:hypothetical protein [Actinomycetota bacterium]
MRTRLVALPLALLLGSFPLLLALASHRDVRDDNDVKGRLDLRKVSIYGRPRVWNIRTYEGWSSRAIWDRGYLLVHLDTLAGERFDYYALVYSNGRSMQGDLFRDRSEKADYRVARLRAWRPSRRALKVRIPLSKTNVGEGRSFFRWQVRTLFTGRKCRRSCIDLAPVAPVKEPLGRKQASPAPSPS